MKTAATSATIAMRDDYNFDVKVGDTLRVIDSTVVETRTVTDVVSTDGSRTVTLDASITAGLLDTWFHQEAKFNVCEATVNGNQTGISDGEIDVDSGHGVEAGDVIRLYDADNDAYILRTVTATGSTTITIDDEGSNFGVTDNHLISCGATIEIWRNRNGGVQLYKVDEVPNDESKFNYISYVDNIPDEQLIEKYVAPRREPFPVPKCSTLVEFQGTLLTAGDPDEPNTVQWSLGDNPEVFSPAYRNIDVPFTKKGAIIGFGETEGFLYVFKEKARALLYGDLPTGAIRVDVKADGVGCSSAHTIESTTDGLIWLSNQGPRRAMGSKLDKSFHYPLKDVFRRKHYEQEDGVAITTAQQSKFAFARAQAVNDEERDLYILYVPGESGTPGGANPYSRYPNDNDATIVTGKL